MPPKPLNDDRSFIKLLVLSIVTLGIYELWHIHHWTKDINEICKDDGKNNEGLLLHILLLIHLIVVYSRLLLILILY